MVDVASHFSQINWSNSMNNPSDIGSQAQVAFHADMKPVLDAFRDVLATHFYQAGCTKRIFEVTDNLEQIVAIASLHVKIGHIDHERSAIRRVNAILAGEGERNG
tara:strand:- start:197 stop:511 length:315 start_codon:yes stop_codon:yes gene_type:complete